MYSLWTTSSALALYQLNHVIIIIIMFLRSNYKCHCTANDAQLIALLWQRGGQKQITALQ